MEIIKKDKNRIYYNEDNEFIDDSVEPSTKPELAPTMHSDSDNHSSNNNRPSSMNFSTNVQLDSLESP